MQDLSKTEAIEKLQRSRGALARIRSKSKETVTRVQRLFAMAAGGALNGALDVKMPLIPGTNTQTSQVLAGALALAGASGIIDDDTLNEFLLGVAGGMLAAEACDATRNALLRAPVQRAA